MKPGAQPPARGLAPTVWRVLPFAVLMALVAWRSAVGGDPGATVLGFDARWLYGVQVLVVAALVALAWRHWGELAATRWPDLRQVAGGLAVGLVVFVAWIHLDAPWMTMDGLLGRAAGPAATFVPVSPEGEMLWALIAVRALGAVVLVPLVEEVFWRSWLMRWLAAQRRPEGDFLSVAPREVGWQALVVSSIVFMLAHPLWLAALTAGIVYAWLYRATGNLWTAVIAHAATNGALAVWVVTTKAWAFW